MGDRKRQATTRTVDDAKAPERPPVAPASDEERRQMEQGDRTKPSQPPGTAPIERDHWPINQDR